MSAQAIQNKDNVTEIIAVCSGKGGTGKTVIASCLGYALSSTGHSTLYVDTDTATDGLSLFLLGPNGVKRQAEVTRAQTLPGDR
ncbi:MAG: P-loop NTPase [Dehalococcoidia bacterium]|mgnify:CR=1 FL=1|jgi:MinD-like ATPase involved in chromosome partitioning or flagellar assembly|nr:P-loop NTPase [Dehalococcoidia bacterium]